MNADQSQHAAARRVWVLTDGKIGDDVQCLAVAEGLGWPMEKRVVAPRAPYEWLAPWGPVEPAHRPGAPASPIAPPFPDLLIASGRRAIPYARCVKQASGGTCFIVIMKNPRIAPRLADFIWAPAHDRLDGENIFTTLTSPHGLAGRLAAARAAPSGPIAQLPRALLGVFLGGPSGGARYDGRAADRLADALLTAKSDFRSLAVTPSRRTPPAFLDHLRARLDGEDVYLWDREGDNPYMDILAHSHSLIVAADSHNMMSEAAATGTGIYAWRPDGLAAKLGWFVGVLEEKGAVRGFIDRAPPFKTTPIDATQDIIAEIRSRLAAASNSKDS